MLRRYFSSSIARQLNVADIKNFSVVGAGQMGTGIAITAASVGKLDKVTVLDANDDALKKSRIFVESWINKEIKKDRLTIQDKESILSRMSFENKLDMAADSQFVIEAVNESFVLKEKIFSTLDEIVPPSTILASNTSSISITKIAATTKRPSQVIGMHYFNPVPVMKGVEIIKALQTSDETVKVTKDLCLLFGKEPVFCKDVPGFVANRILMPWINEAVFCLYEGIATKEDIDKDMTLGTRVPMGPLTLADFIGLDTC